MNGLLLALIAFAATSAAWQGTSVNGVVTDAAGAAIPNAQVTTHSRGVASTRSPMSPSREEISKTNQSGEFSIEIAPDVYEVCATAIGFNRKCEHVEVVGGRGKSVHLQLDVTPTTGDEFTSDGVPLESSSANRMSAKSPDAQLIAVITATDRRMRVNGNESRIEIRRYNDQICVHDFSSSDGEHGYGIDGAEWTPDSQYFVFRLRSTGGHSPMFAPIAFWSRKENRFYSLMDYTGDTTFLVVAPDQIKARTWPGLLPASVSLRSLKKSDVAVLR